VDPTAPPEPAVEPPQRPTGGHGAEAAARKSADPGPRPDEPKRRRPTAAERRYAGFGDGVERASCVARSHRIPSAFPVQRRLGVATLAVRIVARRPGAALLCDGAHSGPHRWPDGGEPAEPAADAAAG
jgi:hypothetical protein